MVIEVRSIRCYLESQEEQKMNDHSLEPIFTEEQVNEACRLLNEIDGEPTQQQIAAIFRSVMAPDS
jgi:hypothetical protein